MDHPGIGGTATFSLPRSHCHALAATFSLPQVGGNEFTLICENEIVCDAGTAGSVVHFEVGLITLFLVRLRFG